MHFTAFNDILVPLCHRMILSDFPGLGEQASISSTSAEPRDIFVTLAYRLVFSMGQGLMAVASINSMSLIWL